MTNQEKMASNLVATYIQTYNQYLEEIFAVDSSHSIIIAELKSILLSHQQETGYAITLGQNLPAATQQTLESINEYFTSDDVEPKHLEHFQDIMQSRLEEYIKQLETMQQR